MSAVALLLLVACKPPSAPVVETLRDGTALVYVRMAGAKETSLRLVIAAGGDDDLPGRGGLAHLVERLVLDGSYDEPPGTLATRIKDAGAVLKTRTGPWFTSFGVDVPNEKFSAAAPILLRAVTSPALPFARLDAAKADVAVEPLGDVDLQAVLFAVSHHAFPTENRGLSVKGDKDARARITQAEVVAFHEEHYVPGNAVAVVVGDVPIDDVRATLDGGMYWPPSGRRRVEEDRDPNAPSEAKALNDVTVTVHGRVVDGIPQRACIAAAGVIEARLRARLEADKVPATIGSHCHRARGHEFMTIYATSTSAQSSTFPDVLREVAHRTAAPTANEKQAVESRLRELHAAAMKSPSDLADRIAYAVSRDDVPFDDTLRDAMRPARADWSGVARALTAVANDDKLVEIHFSRFADGR